MREWVGIERLRLSPLRPGGAIPPVPGRLIDAIREHGPVDPVIVRRVDDGHFEILRNAETWLAVQQLGGHEVPVAIVEAVDDAAARAFLAVQSGPTAVNPMTQAREFAAALPARGDRRGAVRRLAAQTGIGRSAISHALRLLALPPPIQQQLEAGALLVGHARPLVGVRDSALQLRLANRIVRERLTVRQAEALVRDARAGRATVSDTNSGRDPNIERLEQRLSALIGCATRIDVTAGHLIIDYTKDLEVFDGVLARLGYRDG